MGIAGGVALPLVVVLCLLMANHCPLTPFLLTPDQQAQRFFNQERYPEAANTFRDPFRKAAAYYRAGEFKQAASIFSGFDTAEGAFNHANGLAMQGKYEEAIPRYQRALALRPDWEDAQINLAIARQSAEKLKREGGEMTGGQMGADEIQFSNKKQQDRPGEDEPEEKSQPLSDAEMRATWLRRVQTKPADFLKAKFAYQASVSEGGK
jgi:Ca-activated chloride channel family protein